MSPYASSQRACDVIDLSGAERAVDCGGGWKLALSIEGMALEIEDQSSPPTIH